MAFVLRDLVDTFQVILAVIASKELTGFCMTLSRSIDHGLNVDNRRDRRLFDMYANGNLLFIRIAVFVLPNDSSVPIARKDRDVHEPRVKQPKLPQHSSKR